MLGIANITIDIYIDSKILRYECMKIGRYLDMNDEDAMNI